ncbi:unnamed protein product [Effrenium voratum]|nr:unnamed protein product [Effrenium voratum]
MQADYGATANKARKSSIRRDPERQDASRHGNSALLTAGLLIADVVGAGVLAMGQAVAKLGWAMGILGIFLMLAMNAHIMMLVWRVHRLYPDAKTYRELACAAIERAHPDRMELAENLVLVAQYLFVFATLALYTLSIGQGLGMFFYDVHACLPLWTFVGCMLLLPLNLSARFLGSFAGSVMFNCLCTVGTVLIPIAWMAWQGAEVTRPSGQHFEAIASSFSMTAAVTSACTFAFAFSGQFILVEIMSEMEDLEEFPKAYLGYSMPFMSLAFLGVGLSVYYFRGGAASGMIVQELPFGFAERMAATCLVGHMLITYVIKSVVLCRGLLKELQERQVISNGNTWSAWYCIVILIVSSSWLLAQIVPFFSDLVNLLGATLTPLVAFIVPILLYQLSIRIKDVEASTAEQALLYLELLISLVMFAYGRSVSTFLHIYAQWEHYGYPFSCHCQFLWKTCGCSSGRMECPAI